MFDWLKWIKDAQKRKRMEKFAEERRFKLNGPYGFSAHGLLVREFVYLLRYVTGEKYDSFNNFEVISDNFVEINGAIVQELVKPVLREEKVNFTDHEGALHNMRNLQYIVRAITDYVALAKELGLPSNPDVH